MAVASAVLSGLGFAGSRFRRRALAPWRGGQNFFDTPVRGVSLRTLFAGARRSHGRSNADLMRLWDFSLSGEGTAGSPPGFPREALGW